MKNLINPIFYVIVLFTASSFSQTTNKTLNVSENSTDFVTTWDTTKQGISNNTSITIPVISGIYYYNVDWDNDGIFDDKLISNSITHDYKEPGIYTIRISGLFPHFSFNNKGDKLKLIEINQWGNQQWVSVNGMFWGCENLIGKATDKPDLSKVIDMDGMFQNAKKFNQDISDWDTSNVMNMAGLFSGAKSFNQNINRWNTSNVNDMSFMFNKASNFNQNLNNWNTAKVKRMQAMFQLASNFNGDISNWNTKNVTNMRFMFSQASKFNKNISHWNTENVTNMSLMFQGAICFNQDIAGWNISKVDRMYKMFYKAYRFKQDVKWYALSIN